MKVDGKAILERLAQSKGDRTKVSLYLSKGLYDRFKEVCARNDVPASQVMEELMQLFIDSVRGKKS